jgi:hypothetical protein
MTKMHEFTSIEDIENLIKYLQDNTTGPMQALTLVCATLNHFREQEFSEVNIDTYCRGISHTIKTAFPGSTKAN